ncbi:phytoene dehydrogenase-like protein [Streptomyces sp. 1114.5]|uniref:phytoene desaturase family protein n=1 Tax=Streptomyces sp. 1114.5 TaxID=1938830 RepID=UPI000EB58C8D|nr:NAD(P)/FAD-dependent oxidoreductase [Streptomyces sp. 1114.5]RKT19454.1 phytoene dehydrogenase-like protein [Streptomyces sp. 1114.5]
MTTAVVVGSGPNGLAAAIRLAQAGVRVRVLEARETIGGGTRSGERTLPGLIHDDCSAFHPTGVASPFLRSLGLAEYGLRWRWAPVELAHPLDPGAAGVLWRDLDRTAGQMPPADARTWRRVFGRLSRRFDRLADDVLRPVLHLPASPLALAEFGAQALLPASWTAGRWSGDQARALFGGAAAHAFSSLRTPFSSAIGLMLIAVGHAHGWPVAEGGSQAITTAMARLLARLGGTVETGAEVLDLEQLDRPDLVLLDTGPHAAARILGDRLPPRTARAYRRYRYGPAAFKVDLAVEGGIPWTDEHCRSAGAVHLGGTFEEVAAAEEATFRGRMPRRPFVLVGQQYLADPSRSAGDLHPVYAYAHVPHGYRGDATEAVLDRIERFAPGFRTRIRARAVRTVARLQSENANQVGGDITGGANTARQLALRPRLSADPYATGVPGVHLCSAATPPGAGVHGMAGFHAAESALRWLASR